MNGNSSSAQEKIGRLSKDRAELLKLLLEHRSKQSQKIPSFPRTPSHGTVRLPTSWAQQRLWFIDQLEGGSPAYNIATATKLTGKLDLLALRAALDALVGRHEVLRTVFVIVDGNPLQEIAASGDMALQMIDLESRANRAELVRQYQYEEAHAEFNLQQGPLIRGLLLRLNATEHVLLVTMHHIVSDGWSMGVFTRELGKLYGDFLEQRGSSLKPLSIQYADYAQWQRQWLTGDILDKQLTYWRGRLADAPVQLELPTDRARPAVQSYRGRNVDLVIDENLTRRLKAFVRCHEMTLFMVLYAGWSLLLSRLSGQDDVVIGTPIANRQRPELEGLIGFFVNTLAIRIRATGDLPIETFLAHVKDATLGAYAHQDVPFEKVVEALQPHRSLSRNPIFQVMLAVQNTPANELHMPGLEVAGETGWDEPAMFDLLLSLEEKAGRIVGSLNYATDLFDGDTIDRWLTSFTVLLKGLMENVNARVCDAPILPELQRREVIDLFNSTAVVYPQDRLIHELFEEQVLRTPDAVAVEHAGRQLTYAELNRKSNQLARYLLNQGVGPDGLVGICVERGVEMVIGLLAILKAGGAYIPLDPNYPAERLQHMLEDAAPQVILTQEELRGVLPGTQAEVIALDSKLKDIAGYVEENLPAAEVGVRPQHLVYVIYTSGSTGLPKGTAMPHRSMVNLIEWHRKSMPADQAPRVLQFAALSFDVAFQETFSTLCTGGTLVLLDEWIRRDSRALMEFLRSRRIERLFVPPIMLQSLSEYSRAANVVPESVRDVITAGEQLRISPEVSGFFKQLKGCRLHNHYGPTETHVVTALTLAADPEEWPTLPSIGRPISNTQIYVLDGQRRPVPIGVAGEIYIGGAGVAWGYRGQLELTAQRFIDDPFSTEPGAKVYRTGDMGRWRADGTLDYLGRNDNQVKIRGYRIELGEIEAQLARHEQVKESAVIAREDVPGEKRLVAYVTRRDQDSLGVETLRAHLKEVLPEYMVPSAIVTLETLPLTPNGKLDRRALPAPELEAYASKQYEAPEGDTERALAQIWQQLLRVDRVGRQDNFFELGGHSLLGMSLIAKVAEEFEIRLSTIAMFEYPTIQQMAQALTSRHLAHVNDNELSRITFEEGVI